jgi:hypothetical protein
MWINKLDFRQNICDLIFFSSGKTCPWMKEILVCFLLYLGPELLACVGNPQAIP